MHPRVALSLLILLTRALLFVPSPVSAAGTCADSSSAVCAERSPSELDAFRMWGTARRAWKRGEYAAARPLLDRIIAEHPGAQWEARARALKALDLKLQSDWDAAAPEFERALALDPPLRLRHDMQSSQACILLGRGQFDEALDLFERIREETPDWDQRKYAVSWIKEVRRRKAARQYTKLNSCGTRSLAYILQEKGKAVDEDAVLAALGAHRDDYQVSLGTLREAAGVLGLQAHAARVDLEQIAGMPLPLLAFVKPGHYILITGVDSGSYSVLDVDRGRFHMTAAALAKTWTGYVLLFGDGAGGSVAGESIGAELLEGIRGGGCPCCPGGGLGDGPGGTIVAPGGPGRCGAGMPRVLLDTVRLNWLIQDTDLMYTPRVGPVVDFTRTFNNDAATTSVFGHGWTHSYNLFLQEFPGEVQLTRGDGRLDRYLDQGDGTYDPPRGVNDRLEKIAGAFILTAWALKLRYHFSGEGVLEYIEDFSGNRVTLDYFDNTPTVIGAGGGADYIDAPYGIDAAADGSISIADRDNNRLLTYDADGTFLQSWGTYGSGQGQFMNPIDVVWATSGMDHYVYVLEMTGNRVQKFTADGQYVGTWGSYGTGNGQFWQPMGIAVDPAGNVYVADTSNHRVQKFDSQGTFLLAWGEHGHYASKLNLPSGLFVTATAVYVADANRLQEFDLTGGFVREVTAGFQPWDVTVDMDGSFFVTDHDNQ